MLKVVTGMCECAGRQKFLNVSTPFHRAPTVYRSLETHVCLRKRFSRGRRIAMPQKALMNSRKKPSDGDLDILPWVLGSHWSLDDPRYGRRMSLSPPNLDPAWLDVS